MSLLRKKILVIDDTISIRTFLRVAIESHGAAFFEAGLASYGIQMNNDVQPDIVVLDLGLPDREGLDILPEIVAGSNARVIILSVRKENTIKQRAYDLGASGYVTKPFLMEDLLEVMEEHLRPTV